MNCTRKKRGKRQCSQRPNEFQDQLTHTTHPGALEDELAGIARPRGDMTNLLTRHTKVHLRTSLLGLQGQEGTYTEERERGGGVRE